MNTQDMAFCTVISRSYLRHAAALHTAIQRFHPGASLFALVVDVRDGEVLEESIGTGVTIIPINTVPIVGIEDMVIYYDAYELISALKPSLIVHLFRKKQIERLIYLDADIFVVGSFSNAITLLDSYELLLTPHIVAPLPRDGKLPDDLEIADSGVYNGGFWAMRQTPALLFTLDWLIGRLRDQCFFWVERRMFCDQKFLPLVAHFCAGRFHCLRDPGYNIAYWNLHERVVEKRENRFLSNGAPATFFHLSGYSEATPEIFTKHTDRYTAQNHPVLVNVLSDYKDLLDTVPFQALKGYRYQTYQGISLNTALRRHYFQHRSFDAVPSLSDDALFQIGLAHYNAGKLKDAAVTWGRLSERSPQHFPAVANLSVCLTRLKDWTSAIEANRRVIALAPQNEQALFNLGYALHELGRFDEARDVWRKLLAINPDHPQAQASLTHLNP